MKKIKYIVLLLCATFALKGSAQTAKSAYFLDGTFHNFKLNPAMKAERGFFSFGLGNLTLGTNGNVGVSHFLYPKDDHLTTFMSSSVDQNEFLDRLPKSICLGMNFDETLLAFGFRMFGGYTSFSLSMHSSTSMALPKELFKFATTGLQENTFDFSGANLNSTSYAAATLGYSHEVYKGLRVGVNLKYLMGLAYADATLDKFNVELSENQWMIETHAQVQAALISELYIEEGQRSTFDNLQFGPFSPAAHGFAVDLGVVYDMSEFVPGLTLSASVIDLGRIKWQYMMSIENGGTPIKWEGLKEGDFNNLSASLEDEFATFGDNTEQIMDIDDIGAKATNLNATMFLGAEYNMPFYKPLSVAMLYGKKFSPYVYGGWDEFRGYINIAPLKWFEASANFGYSTFGTTFGWMLNIHPAGIAFFLGSDYMITKVTPQYLPVNNLNYNLTFGVNLALGKRK